MLFRFKSGGTGSGEPQTLAGQTVLPGALSFARRFLGPVFADCATAVFLSAGFCMAVFNFTVFETDFLSNFLLAFISVLALAILRLRWQTGPLLLLSALLADVAYRYFSRGLKEWSDYWISFFRWAFWSGGYDQSFSDNGSLFLFRLAIVFLITLGLFIIIRKLFSFTLILVSAACVFSVVYIISGLDLSGAVCSAAAGIIIALPRVYRGYAARRGRALSENNRAAMQLIAVPAAALSVSLSLWMVPPDASAWRSKWLNDLIYDISSLFSGPLNVQPQGSGNFSLHSLGYQSVPERLGGPARLKGSKILTVSGTQIPVLLRGAVMDYYDGKNWLQTGSDGDFRYNRFFWRGYRNEAFGLNLPSGNSDAKKLFKSISMELDLNITYETASFTNIFAGGRVKGVDFSGSAGGLEPFFNMRSELYASDRLTLKQQASLKTIFLDRTAQGFDENFLELERLMQDQDDKRYETILSRYTALPESLPESVRNAALEITGGEASPYLQSKAIESWLRDGFTYTLEPDLPPEDSDFVEYFLETKEGYCTYYSTAMAVLARCAGLPSRYVTGFALESDPAHPSIFTATGKTAHAWTEIYFKGIGWVEFDPLEWDPSNPLNREAENAPPSPQIVPDPPGRRESDEYGALLLPSGEPSPETAAPSDGFDWLAYILLFLGSAASVMAVRAFIAMAPGLKLRQYDISKIIRKEGSLDNALACYYTDILRQLSLMDITPRPGETLVTFPGRIDKRIAIEGLSLSRIAGSLMLARFAEEEPSRADVEEAWRYHAELEAMVLEKLGKVRYIWARVVLDAA